MDVCEQPLKTFSLKSTYFSYMHCFPFQGLAMKQLTNLNPYEIFMNLIQFVSNY
jgi:hypothetical protein